MVMESELSRSEFEIAEHLALGESKKEVAFKTHRSIYTVETTVKNIYCKLGFSKLAELVLWYCGKVFGIAEQISERRNKFFKLNFSSQEKIQLENNRLQLERNTMNYEPQDFSI